MAFVLRQAKKKTTSYRANKNYNTTPPDFQARDIICRRLTCDDTTDVTIGVTGSVDIDGTLAVSDDVSCTGLTCTTPTFSGHINLCSSSTLPTTTQLGNIQRVVPSTTTTLTLGSTTYNVLSASCVKGAYIIHARLRLSTTAALAKFDVSEVKLIIAESATVAVESSQYPWRKVDVVPVSTAITYGDHTTDVYVKATTFANFTANTTV